MRRFAKKRPIIFMLAAVFAYHTYASHGVQCADDFASIRVVKRDLAANRLVDADATFGGVPIPCVKPALSNDSLRKWPRASMLPTLSALVISGSPSCFERTRRQAASAKLTAKRVGAVLDIEEPESDAETTSAPKCQDSQHQRIVDGITSAHRRAWAAVDRSNTSMVILEEDAELIGDAADLREAVERCEHASPRCEIACNLAYLTSP